MKISKEFKISLMVLAIFLSPFIINGIYGWVLKYVPGTMYVENTDTWLLLIGNLIGSFIAIWGVWWQVIYIEKKRKRENVLKYIEFFFKSVLGETNILKKNISHSHALIGFALDESLLPRHLKIIEPMNQKFINGNISTVIELENIGEEVLELNKNINLSIDLFDEIKNINGKQKKVRDIIFLIHRERLKKKGLIKDLIDLVKNNQITYEEFELLIKNNEVTLKGIKKLYELDIIKFKDKADIMTKIDFFHNIIHSYCLTGENKKDELTKLKDLGINLTLTDEEYSLKNSKEIFKSYFKLLEKAFNEYIPEAKNKVEEAQINEVADVIKMYGGLYVYNSCRAYELIIKILKNK